MKKIILFLLSSILLLPLISQTKKLSFAANMGYSLVNVEKAMDTDLENWNKFSYGMYIQVLKMLKYHHYFGGEFGVHNLYWWEEMYTISGGTRRWREANVTTIKFGTVFERETRKKYEWQVGAFVHLFSSDKSIAPSIMLGCHYPIKISDRVRIPAGFRIDTFFSKGVPVTFNVTLGVRYLAY